MCNWASEEKKWIMLFFWVKDCSGSGCVCYINQGITFVFSENIRTFAANLQINYPRTSFAIY